MTGRRGARLDRTSRAVAAVLPAHPAQRFGARTAWRADGAVVNASVVDSIVPWIGTGTLIPGGTKKSQPVANANLGGRLAIPSNGSGVGYSVALNTPSTLTLITVARYDTSSSGFCAYTVGGAVNTGSSQLYQSGVGVIGRGLAASATVNPGAIASVVVVSVITSTGTTSYVNSRTPATGAGGPTALAGNSFRLFDIASAGTFPLNGSWAETMEFSTAFTSAQAAYALTYFGALYGITIT